MKIQIKTDFSRLCDCGVEIFYSSKKSLEVSSKRKSSCYRCGLKKLSIANRGNSNGKGKHAKNLISNDTIFSGKKYSFKNDSLFATMKRPLNLSI